MKRTLLKVKNLEKFIEKHGEDPFISQSISKMLDYKIKHYEAEIKRLDKELKAFERTHGMKSSVFLRNSVKAGLAMIWILSNGHPCIRYIIVFQVLKREVGEEDGYIRIKCNCLDKRKTSKVGLRHETQRIIEYHERLMLGFTYVQPNLPG